MYVSLLATKQRTAMTKVPDFTPAKWDKWLKDKKFAEDRVEHLEDELDKALDGEFEERERER